MLVAERTACRRLISLICAGWLPHDNRFVGELPFSRIEDQCVATCLIDLPRVTDPQVKTLRAICEILEVTGLPPTVKELADALGVSHASAHEQIAQLVRKGDLRKEERKARSIVIVKRLE